MQYLSVFLLFFLAQAALLKLLRGVSAPAYQYDRVIARPEAVRKKNAPDDIDYLLFEATRPYDSFLGDFTLSGGDAFLNALVQKALTPAPQSRLSFSAHVYALYLLPQPCGGFLGVKNLLCRLAEAQSPDGELPDYFSDRLAIRGSGTAAAALPLAAALYCDYTGDVSVLQERISYALPGEKTIYAKEPGSAVGTLYEHCIRALDAFDYNEYGLLRVRYAGSVFENLGLPEEFSDAAAGLFYCYAAESFSRYMPDYREKAVLLTRARRFKENAAHKLRALSGGGDKLYARILYALCLSDGDAREALTEVLRGGGIEEKRRGFENIFLLLFGFYLLSARDVPAAEAVFGLLPAELSAAENTLLAAAAFQGLMGLGFKCGRLSVKPAVASFALSFRHGEKAVDIRYDAEKYSGLKIDGLRINNLDYIGLKSYNRDVQIFMGESVADTNGNNGTV
jgi:hypothetical protein